MSFLEPNGAMFVAKSSYYKFGRFGHLYCWIDSEWRISRKPIELLMSDARSVKTDMGWVHATGRTKPQFRVKMERVIELSKGERE